MKIDHVAIAEMRRKYDITDMIEKLKKLRDIMPGEEEITYQFVDLFVTKLRTEESPGLVFFIADHLCTDIRMHKEIVTIEPLQSMSYDDNVLIMKRIYDIIKEVSSPEFFVGFKWADIEDSQKYQTYTGRRAWS